MEICKIVFTGGPCAGKTTQIKLVKEYLEKKGYKVITVSETATDVINSGIEFKFIDSLMNFQNIMLKVQDFKERLYQEELGYRDEKIIMLFDRGIIDNKAYFENYKDFDFMMKTHNKSEIDILDNYDLVIDLLSLASCSPERYNLSSNLARTETVEIATKLDEKTSNVWAGHKNLYLFNSNVSIEEEFKLIIDKIENFIEKKNFKKIESFEIENNLEDFESYNDNNSRLINVEKIFLDNNYVIYRRTYKGKVSYILNYEDEVKSYDKKITFEEYIEFINRHDIINSEMYLSLNFVRNKQLFEIKFYFDRAVLEYEENKMNDKIELPEEIKFCKAKQNVLR